MRPGKVVMSKWVWCRRKGPLLCAAPGRGREHPQVWNQVGSVQTGFPTWLVPDLHRS